LVNGQKDPIGLVCGYSTPMPQESFPVVEIPPNNYFGRRRERLPWHFEWRFFL